MYQICKDEFQELHDRCVAEIFASGEAEDVKMLRRMEKRGALPQTSLVPTHHSTTEEEEAKEKEEKELAEDDAH